MMHRTGRSYHLPTGGAIYFDTGVIEIATPLIEIDAGCAARAGRSLWESIRFLRQELDAWEEREGRTVQLSGFSTHYNVSFEIPAHERAARARRRQARQAADAHRARADDAARGEPALDRASACVRAAIASRSRRTSRPTPSLMIAAATLVVGVVREVMTWPSFELDALAAHGVPVARRVHAGAAQLAQGMGRSRSRRSPKTRSSAT